MTTTTVGIRLNRFFYYNIEIPFGGHFHVCIFYFPETRNTSVSVRGVCKCIIAVINTLNQTIIIKINNIIR